MSKRHVISLLFLITAWLLVEGCAKISSPSGGPKDKTSPVIVKSVPENGTVNFSEKEITVSFNEYVVLENINEKFMVSPPMAKKPEIVIRGKSMRIRFEEKLRDSTTYTFYFQDAIRDLNEGNPINNYQFVFSTGPFIDSLSVTGNVYSALTLDPPENTLAMLYRQMEDSSVVKQLPDYITRVEQNGEFRIDNVNPGKFRLYGLKDGDNSKNYNRRDEEFAFLDTIIEITPGKNFLPVKKDTTVVVPAAGAGKVPVKPPEIGEYALILFQAEKKDRYLTSSTRKLAYNIVYTLSLPPDSLEFDFSIPDAKEEAWFIEKNLNRDTITIWLTDSSVYNRPQLSTIVRFPFTDTLGIVGYKTDTIVMRYTAPRPTRSKVVKRTSYVVNMGNLSGQVRPDKQIVLTSPTPFGRVDTSKILFYEVLKDARSRVPYILKKDTANSCRYFLDTRIASGKSYLLIADSAAFGSIYGEYSDSTAARFSVMVPEQFGSLTLDVINHEGGAIIQLLDNSEKLRRETYMEGNGKIKFPLLEKGFYRVKAIFDPNGDRKWTTGDFDTHRQPEPVTFYPEEIEIKENWDVIQPHPWDLGKKNYKEPKLQKIKTTGR